jgi:hypothetical protein
MYSFGENTKNQAFNTEKSDEGTLCFHERLPFGSVPLSGHFPASCCASRTFLRTFTTMIHFMPATFLSTLLANFRANGTNSARFRTVQAHHLSRGCTDCGTFHCQAQTIGHRSNICFGSTGISAIVAHSGTLQTCVNTISLISVAIHNSRFFLKVKNIGGNGPASYNRAASDYYKLQVFRTNLLSGSLCAF